MATPLSPKDLEDAFIKVTFEEDTPLQQGVAPSDPLYDPWIDQCGCSFLPRRVALSISEYSVQ